LNDIIKCKLKNEIVSLLARLLAVAVARLIAVAKPTVAKPTVARLVAVHEEEWVEWVGKKTHLPGP
jgi:hypothetical protein